MTDRIIERDDGQPGETQLPRPARRSRTEVYLHDIAQSLRKLTPDPDIMLEPGDPGPIRTEGETDEEYLGRCRGYAVVKILAEGKSA